MISWKCKKHILITVLLLCVFMLSACTHNDKDVMPDEVEMAAEIEDNEDAVVATEDDTVQVSEDIIEEPEEETEIDIDIEEDAKKPLETDIEEEETEEVSQEVDLIMFMGQSNMSGCGGDAAYAPVVRDGAGYEYRAISDPTKLYPVSEPFGINENNINGIIEKPGGKKGSLVSAFVNKYYEETNTSVIAVSASVGETDMDKWLQSSMQLDALSRYMMAKQWLESNNYTVRHKYIVWLQGESDGLKRISSDGYKTKMDDFIRPFFIEGVEKLFFITPGRTIDDNQIYSSVIKAQLEMSAQSSYYGLATSVLCGVSTEYMYDIYHYNQHVLNMVGEEAAKSVAYYTNTGHEMVTYNYRYNEIFIPDGTEEFNQETAGPIDLTNINERY